MVEVPFAFHGYAAFFCSSILDRHWRPNLTEAEAIELLKLCLNELKIRFIVNFPEFAVSIVDANGTRQIQL
jgi:20S proteasome subunit beta 4